MLTTSLFKALSKAKSIPNQSINFESFYQHSLVETIIAGKVIFVTGVKYTIQCPFKHDCQKYAPVGKRNELEHVRTSYFKMTKIHVTLAQSALLNRNHECKCHLDRNWLNKPYIRSPHLGFTVNQQNPFDIR